MDRLRPIICLNQGNACGHENAAKEGGPLPTVCGVCAVVFWEGSAEHFVTVSRCHGQGSVDVRTGGLLTELQSSAGLLASYLRVNQGQPVEREKTTRARNLTTVHYAGKLANNTPLVLLGASEFGSSKSSSSPFLGISSDEGPLNMGLEVLKVCLPTFYLEPVRACTYVQQQQQQQKHEPKRRNS